MKLFKRKKKEKEDEWEQWTEYGELEQSLNYKGNTFSGLGNIRVIIRSYDA